MIKFLFITILVIYLSIKVAGFVIRLFLRSAGFTIQSGSRQGRGPANEARAQGPQAQAKPDAGRHVTDSLGDYVDYEEVK